MKRSFYRRVLCAVILAAAGPATAGAASYRGDVDRDGKVDMKDMSMLCTALNNQYFAPPKDMDFNADGKVNDGDLHYLADLIIQGKLIDNSGVNVGIGGWDDSGEDFGGTVGGNNRAGSTRAEGTFAIGAGGISYDAASGIVARELTVAGTPSGVLVDLVVPSEVTLDPADVAVLAGNGIATDHRLYGTPRLMNKNGESHLRFVVMSPKNTSFAGEGAFCRIRYKTAGRTDKFRLSDCQSTGGTLYNGDPGVQWAFILAESIGFTEWHPAEGYRMAVGETRDLSVSVSPEDASDKSVEWSSSDDRVATVDGNGHVEIVGSGSASVTARTIDGSNLSASVSFTGYVPVSGVSITAPDLGGKQPVEGDELTLTAVVLPENADNKTVKWSSSDQTIATVDENTGKVTFLKPGEVTITATTVDGAKTATVKFVVERKVIAVESVSITAPDLGGKKPVEGDVLTLTAVVLPENADDKTVKWSSSDQTIAKVDENTGKVTFLRAGEVTITATTVDGAKTATVKFTVERKVIAVESVSITVPDLGGKQPVEGDVLTLTAVVLPENADDKTVKWSSSDPAIATVDENTGKVTFLKAGEVTITATTVDGAKTATVKFVVERKVIAVESVSITAPDLGGKQPVEGDELTLTAVVLPENADDKTVKWSSSDPAIATVDENTGKVTFLKAGEVTITATTVDGAKTATMTFTVDKKTVAVGGVVIDDPGLGEEDPIEGSTLQLSVTVTPADASMKKVTWSSSDPTVATVDENGLVHFLKPGKVTISVKTTDGSDITASYSFTCVARKYLAESITLIDDTTGEKVPDGGLSLEEGSSRRLRAVITPDNTTDKSVEWLSSDNSLATVSDGVVNVKKAGVVTITVHTLDGSDLRASCTITGTSGIEQVLADITGPVDIYSINGMLIKKGVAKEEASSLPRGTYIIKSTTCTIKIRL